MSVVFDHTQGPVVEESNLHVSLPFSLIRLLRRLLGIGLWGPLPVRNYRLDGDALMSLRACRDKVDRASDNLLDAIDIS